jgi:multiple sugar transport system permease protein
MRRKGRLGVRIGKALAVALILAWSLAPMLLIVSSSFKPARDIFAVPPALLFHPTVEHYFALWQHWPTFFSALGNSLLITALATVLAVVASAMAGYAYSRFRSAWLSASAFWLIVARLIPPIVVTLPLFPLFSLLRLNDTHLVLVLLYSAFFVSLATWIMRAFIDQVPRELEEAARVDGAHLFHIFRHVILPLVTSGMLAAGLFVAVYAWNEFVFALVFTTRDARTTPMVMSEMLSTTDGVDWGVLFAAATLQLAPVLASVLAAQRYVIAGLTAGAVKG